MEGEAPWGAPCIIVWPGWASGAGREGKRAVGGVRDRILTRVMCPSNRRVTRAKCRYVTPDDMTDRL